jgi:ATP-binding cassette subfamily F protein 3
LRLGVGRGPPERDIADKQRQSFPRTDEVVVSYIAGLVEDEDEEVDDIVDMTKGMLASGPSSSDTKVLDEL